MENEKDSTGAWDAEFAKLARGLYPVAHGTLAQVRKPCANPNCAACRSGRRHAAWTFTYRQGGKQRCMHVQPKHVESMRRAIENGRRLEAAIVDAGVAFLKRLREGGE